MTFNAVNQFVAEPLVVAFAVVMCHELFECAAEVPFTQWDDPIQTFLFNRANKSLCVRIAVWCAERCPDQPHTSRLKHRLNRGAPLAIPVTDKKPLRLEHTIDRQLARALDHERFVRMRRGADDVDPSRVSVA